MILINPILICSMKSTGFTKRWYTEVTELKMSMCIFNLIHTMKKKRYTTLFIILHTESVSVGQRLIHNARSVPSVSRYNARVLTDSNGDLRFQTFPGSVAPVSCRCLSGVAAGSTEPRTRGVYAFST